MRKKLTLAVLMGGKSPEHQISLISGREVVKNLDRRKYEVLPIIIPKGDRKGPYSSSDRVRLASREVSSKVSLPRAKSRGSRQARTIIDRLEKVDVVFIAMHGPFGEDGTIQGFLELIGVPYTGSGVLASALGMDKISSRKLCTQAGLTVPKYMVVDANTKPQSVWSKFKPPVFIKPFNQGSSVGASIAREKNDLKKALKLAFSFSRLALVEEYLEGIEVTGSILGNENPQALPLVEIIPKHEFFDYEAKYNQKLTDEIVPARINKTLTEKAQKAALIAYKTLGCRGFGRVDMIIKNNDVYVFEVNTIPGLTPVSLFPKAAAAADISYATLLDKIIEFALKN